MTNRLRSRLSPAVVIAALATLATLFTLPLRAEAPRSATLRGRIADIDGKPVGGGEVYFYNNGDTRRPADFISPKTGPDGRYAAVVSPGKYWVVARVRKGGRYGPLKPGERHSGPPEEIELGAGEDFPLDFVVADLKETARRHRKTREDYFTVRGRILSRKGMPLADRYVVASRKKTPSRLPEFISAWTGADGRYILYIPRGRYWIAAASRFPPTLKEDAMGALEIGGDVHDFDITADAGRAE